MIWFSSHVFLFLHSFCLTFCIFPVLLYLWRNKYHLSNPLFLWIVTWLMWVIKNNDDEMSNLCFFTYDSNIHYYLIIIGSYYYYLFAIQIIKTWPKSKIAKTNIGSNFICFKVAFWFLIPIVLVSNNGNILNRISL